MISSMYDYGVNDVSFPISYTSNGKNKSIPSYNCWRNMRYRCYSSEFLLRQPTYIGCTVFSEWHKFSVFHEWYENQYKEQGWQLDKDLLIPGNKIYKPNACVFVSQEINKFTNDNLARKGRYMIGVYWDNYKKRYRAECRNPFTKKSEKLGRFKTEIEAHLAWKSRKHEMACQVAETITHSDALADALRSRYKT